MLVVWWTIGFLLCFWLIVSCFFCADWFLRPNERFWDNHKYLKIAIGIGAFLGSMTIVVVGVYRLLWFIPESWILEEEEGGYTPVRIVLATFIGLGASSFLAILHGRIILLRRENERLGTELDITREIARRKREYELLENDELEVRIKGLRLELTAFEELAITDKITPSQEIEQRVLIGLLDELEKRMEIT